MTFSVTQIDDIFKNSRSHQTQQAQQDELPGSKLSHAVSDAAGKPAYPGPNFIEKLPVHAVRLEMLVL
jgi:hypothetical protein